jgi:hypothetical protein
VESCTALGERADGSLVLLTFAEKGHPVAAPHRPDRLVLSS